MNTKSLSSSTSGEKRKAMDPVVKPRDDRVDDYWGDFLNSSFDVGRSMFDVRCSMFDVRLIINHPAPPDIRNNKCA